MAEHPRAEHIGWGRQVGELKHLSTPRKEDHSLSSGERKGSSLNLCGLTVCEPVPYGGCRAEQGVLQRSRGVTNRIPSRRVLERPAEGGDSPVCERVRLRFRS